MILNSKLLNAFKSLATLKALAALTLFAGLQAQAHEFHTGNYCNQDVKNFCAHVGYDQKPNVGDEFKFLVHFMTPAETLAQIQSIEVELVMPSMGHGSAPVHVERLDKQHFEVSEAYFPMEGEWMIVVHAQLTSGKLDIQIPMTIQ